MVLDKAGYLCYEGLSRGPHWAHRQVWGAGAVTLFLEPGTSGCWAPAVGEATQPRAEKGFAVCNRGLEKAPWRRRDLAL